MPRSCKKFTLSYSVCEKYHFNDNAPPEFTLPVCPSASQSTKKESVCQFVRQQHQMNINYVDLYTQFDSRHFSSPDTTILARSHILLQFFHSLTVGELILLLATTAVLPHRLQPSV
ncbi:unnamed protein product [Ceratitis capitata]|uniref:(Mediterranean fruit fly) hypothetical protein n=1 Tax=Ceratitis capitata TaxID=7213 RepID=A0A811URH5_CERCA|nr:unnamed protein product [Ceratitis capitata]